MSDKNFYFVRISYSVPNSNSGGKATVVFYPECEAKNFEKEVEKLTKRIGPDAEVIAVTKL